MTAYPDPEQIRNEGRTAVFKKSLGNYIGTVIIAVMATLWGLSSIVYALKRTAALALLSGLTGQPAINLNLPLDIFFTVGLFMNISYPWMAKTLFYPAQISVTRFGVEYSSRGTVKQMSWADIKDITSTRGYASRAARNGSKEFIVIQGKNERIKIEAVYDLPTDKFIQFLQQCRDIFNEPHALGDSTYSHPGG